ncbi:WW domain-binding protein 4 [Episyrphus balteatus]|uniref:WW domain-binding protein 4 n=1 Tax=Episyrphus balteatus TaxID=286459 RepID=UPI0024857E70|nr:WW domain-binding protein 4 [Episyrphus balteatus]
MTDYWKSNEKKYCDFCKCWISDNKASIAFHESGKRHKASVAKRITDISRSSEKSEKERQKMDMEIRKMEEAALRSYAMDIHSKGDMTARSVSSVMSVAGASGSHLSGGRGGRRPGQIDPMRLPGSSDEEGDDNDSLRPTVGKVPDPESVPNASLWVQAKSDEGHIYYWNVKTNESVWTEPKEGFLSIEEYDKINKIAEAQQEIQMQQEAKEFQKNAPEEVAKYNRERLKMYRRKDPIEETAKEEKRQTFKTEEESKTPEIGAWVTVEKKPEEKPINWELPVSNNYYVPPVVSEIPYEPPVKRFKEKTIESLDPSVAIGVPTAFKKRKFAAKGNARQRLPDDNE